MTKVDIFTYGTMVVNNSSAIYISLRNKKQIEAVEGYVQEIQQGYGELRKIWEQYRDSNFKNEALCKDAEKIVERIIELRNKQVKTIEQMKGR
jgi:hypothetical protein